MDASTHTPLGADSYCRSIELSEQEFGAEFKRTQAKSPEFESSYLLPGTIWCTPCFPKSR